MVNAAKRLLPILWPISLLAYWPYTEHGFMAAKMAGMCTLALLAAIIYKPRFSHPALPYWLLLAWALITGLWSTHPLDYFTAITPFALILLLYSIAANLPPLQNATQAAACVCAAAVLLSAYLPDDIFGGMGNPNFAAHFLLATLALQDPQQWRQKPANLAAAILQIAAILFSGSRAGILGLIILSYSFAPQNIKRKLLVASAIIAIITAAWFRTDLVQFYNYASQPQQYIAAYRQQPHLLVDRDPWFKGKRLSLMSRIIVYGNSAKAIADAPLFGHGAGQFRVTYPAYNGSFADDILLDGDYRVHAAHNLPIQLTLELGLLGLVLFTWAMRQLWRRADINYRRLLAIQLFLSLVSVNYLNIAILALLAITAPRPKTQPTNIPIAFIIALLTCTAWLAVDRFQAQAKYGQAPAIAQTWFPEAQARHAYQTADYQQAWHDQQQALARDPHGPEIWVNLGHIATALSQTAATPQARQAWRNTATSWYQKVAQTYPDVRYEKPPKD